MRFTEEEAEKAAELRLWVEDRIAKLEDEIDKLREILVIIDSILRVTSFKVASDLALKPRDQEEPVAIIAEKLKPSEPEIKEIRPLKRSKDNYLMGNAYISDSKIVIIPSNDVRLEISTTPFESFFIDRILEGMKSKDREIISQGKIDSKDMIRFGIEDENGIIKKITVENYREKRRLNEIINTSIWTFTRMLEKVK
ncbi:MAG: hypothetical protein L6N96_03515 [Candidatus Methylarchaceae archaeon HK02M2]|nr:hypothetical protein [Candidatus Methylarchaceae archaeon HK02M2]